jgi:polyisoprenoid-binding protein YceI
MRRLPLSLIAAALLSSSVIAQPPAMLPGTPDTAKIAAGTYAVEPQHTQVLFSVDHMGFSIYRGLLSGASGSLTLDPARPAAAKLSVSVPTGSIQTTVPKLTGELVQPDWLDSAQFPAATFTSTKITLGPDNTALIEGDLTLHGVTKPVQMHAHFRGAGTNPYSKATTIGFDGRIGLERSDFGVTKLLALVSDHVEITIAAAFEKQ